MDMGFHIRYVAFNASHLLISNSVISVNGCGMKTADNLTAAKAIRPEKIMFETGAHNNVRISGGFSCGFPDAPWCSMTSTHASNSHLSQLPANLRALYFPQAMKPESFVYGRPVKGRNEPSAVGGVAWVVHRLNEGVPLEKVTEKAWKNTIELFGLHELAEK